MNDAPERIWAFYAPEIGEDNPGCNIVAGEKVMHGAQQYIRADLVPSWQPIETAVAGSAIVYDEKLGVIPDAYLYGAPDTRASYGHYNNTAYNVTHWMSLPKGPANE